MADNIEHTHGRASGRNTSLNDRNIYGSEQSRNLCKHALAIMAASQPQNELSKHAENVRFRVLLVPFIVLSSGFLHGLQRRVQSQASGNTQRTRGDKQKAAMSIVIYKMHGGGLFGQYTFPKPRAGSYAQSIF
jgi:hypothetical protein